MRYKVKSIMLGRKKREHRDDEAYPCYISLFDMNNPHTSGQVPKQTIDIPLIHKVVVKGLDLNYLLEGNDIVINDLDEIDLEVKEGHVYITGKQKSGC